MLMIRLQRVGRKNDPSFRVVLTDSRNSTKSGKLHSVLGSYNPRFGKPVFQSEKILHWLKNGAQATPTIHNLLVKEGVVKGEKINVVKKKKAAAEAPKEKAVEAKVAERAVPTEVLAEALAEAPVEETTPPKEETAEEKPKEV